MHIHSPPLNVLFDGDLEIMRVLYLTEVDDEDLQTCMLNRTSLRLPSSPVYVRTLDFDVFEHFFYCDDDKYTDYFHTAANEIYASHF